MDEDLLLRGGAQDRIDPVTPAPNLRRTPVVHKLGEAFTKCAGASLRSRGHNGDRSVAHELEDLRLMQIGEKACKLRRDLPSGSTGGRSKVGGERRAGHQARHHQDGVAARVDHLGKREMRHLLAEEGEQSAFTVQAAGRGLGPRELHDVGASDHHAGRTPFRVRRRDVRAGHHGATGDLGYHDFKCVSQRRLAPIRQPRQRGHAASLA